jgi:glycerol-3-phosphate cytidylyltransferase
MTRILTYGTFDLFHIGHLNLLKRLRAMGDYLVVGVSTDEFNALKGKKTVIPYEDRAAIVEALSCVDLVFPETAWEQKVADIQRYDINCFVMGDDWLGKFDDLKSYCEVKYLPRTPNISSSALKSNMSGLDRNAVENIKAYLDDALDLLQALR